MHIVRQVKLLLTKRMLNSDFSNVTILPTEEFKL